MEFEQHITDKIDEFFERTCITKYIFKKGKPTEILQMKKKTPIGTWNIESVELIYFINEDDHVIISILSDKDDGAHRYISRILENRAKLIK